MFWNKKPIEPSIYKRILELETEIGMLKLRCETIEHREELRDINFKAWKNKRIGKEKEEAEREKESESNINASVFLNPNGQPIQ